MRLRYRNTMENVRSPLLFALWALFASAASAATTQELYIDRCAMCHLPGIAGAPGVGDQAEWTRRVRSGMNLLYRNAVEGMPNTAMMPKGGHTDLTDGEFKAIVDLMLAAARLPPAALEAAARYDRRRISNRDFIRLDANLDGALAREELAADPVLLKSFARFDADRDGKLNVAEYENAETRTENWTQIKRRLTLILETSLNGSSFHLRSSAFIGVPMILHISEDMTRRMVDGER